MAIKYVKLGPIGTTFNSDKLGLYLSPGQAAEIDESLYDYILKSFFLTGFLVEVTKVEYDNIKLSLSNARNIPLLIVPITNKTAIEPVEKLTSFPPTSVFKGNRYIVYNNPQEGWEGKKDYIAEFTDEGWIFIKPTNGLSVPIYHWGISATYVGTFPSGKWQYDEALVSEIETTLPLEVNSNAFAFRLFEAEAKARKERDEELTLLITNIQNSFGSSKATAISIEDTDGYFQGNNVEIALAELAITLNRQGKAISDINQYLLKIIQTYIDVLFTEENSGIILDKTTNPNYTIIRLDYDEIIATIGPELKPRYMDNLDADNPTLIQVGGILAGTVFDPSGVDHNELWYRALNPYTQPIVGLSLSGHFSTMGGYYNFRWGQNFTASLNWSITKKSNPITGGNFTRANTPVPDLPTPTNPLTAGSLSGTATPEITLNTTNSIYFQVIDGANNPQVGLNYRFIKPMFHGAIDSADVGKSNADLYAVINPLNKNYLQKQNNNLAFNYSGKRMIVAYPAEYGVLTSILDQNGFESISSFNQRAANIVTNDQDNNYTIPLIIYEGLLDNAVNGIWQFKF